MAGWFAKLMQKGHDRAPGATAAAGRSTPPDAAITPPARDARFDAIVQRLRDRADEDRDAREKRQRWYQQHLKSDPPSGGDASGPSPIRLSRFRTRVPCRCTPEARALLDELRRQFSGGTVTFAHVTHRRQAVMLSRGAGARPRQIGWVEQCVDTDPARCNVQHQGLTVETDGGTMLMLRFRYPATPVRMSSGYATDEGEARSGARRLQPRVTRAPGSDARELPLGAIDEVASVDFSEIRPALDLRPSDKGPSPRLVWVTRPEIETLNALSSRDYEAFYVRFKLEVAAGIWNALSAVLANSPVSQWHEGAHYTVVREPDPATGKISQRTVDDSGRTVDVGADRVYDAFPATDILLLYLDGDLLADFANIYFTLHSVGSADAYFLKEEFFTIIRRFWTGSQSLASRYGSGLAAVVRMSQRAVPMPAQALLLKQDWSNLRQALVDRYGEGGRTAPYLDARDVHRPRIGPTGWPFASFAAGDVNVGVRLVYRQEWRHLDARRGEVISATGPAPTPVAGAPGIAGEQDPRSVETTIERGDRTATLDELLATAVNATVEAMKWPLDLEGSINIGVSALAATTDMGLEAESRERCHDTSTRLTDIMWRMATSRDDTAAVSGEGSPEDVPPSPSPDGATTAADDDTTRICSRLQNRYEILTRPARIHNVVLVAEKLPTPAEINRAWVARHGWILARVLLDESFRAALESIGRSTPLPAGTSPGEPRKRRTKRQQRDAARDEAERLRRIPEGDASRERLCEHIRANILHYQRAIWRQEDPQQRSMRYRKAGRKVPLEWRFELESSRTLTIDDLGDLLAAPNVDGQFAAYSTGRSAYLDQVIDPAGPVGYYGNYAIYHMRPEFGSGSLFSMLHFFKSPYLRPNPGTGEPEVEDPVQIRIAADRAVTGASGEATEQHRAARRMTLDTDSVVVDVIRRVHPAPAPAGHGDAFDMALAAGGYQLLLDQSGEMLQLTANADSAQVGWSMLRDGREQSPRLLAGAGAARPRASDVERVIDVHVDAERRPRLLAGGEPGGARDVDVERMIVVRADGPGTPRLLLGPGTAGARDAEVDRAIVVQGGGKKSSSMLTGGGVGPVRDRIVVAHDDEWLTPSPVAGEAGPSSPAHH